jgi:hypothetical protein
VAVIATLSKGYDLEYIWRQVDRGPAKDAAGYYLQASESGGSLRAAGGARALRRSAWSGAIPKPRDSHPPAFYGHASCWAGTP